MSIYAYARVSTKKQNLERQIRNILKAYPQATIFEEKYTGTTTNRNELNKLIKRLRAGDTVVFDSVSRMSRNAEEGFVLYEKLFNAGVSLVFLKEPHINTDTYKNALNNSIQMTGTAVDSILKGVNEYLLILAKEQIKIAFEQAEKEVEDIHQRIKEGIITAQLNGKQVGCKKGIKKETQKAKETKELILKLSKDFNGNLSDVELMKVVKVARNSFYKYKSELKQGI